MSLFATGAGLPAAIFRRLREGVAAVATVSVESFVAAAGGDWFQIGFRKIVILWAFRSPQRYRSHFGCLLVVFLTTKMKTFCLL